MKQSSNFSFPDKFVLVHLSGVDISWSSKLVFHSASISLQIFFSDLRKGDGRYGNEEKMREKDEEKEGEKESKKMN